MKPLAALFVALALSGCAFAYSEEGPARITKQVGLIGCVSPTGIAIGPCYSMWAEFQPDECRSVVIGDNPFTFDGLRALCYGDQND